MSDAPSPNARTLVVLGDSHCTAYDGLSWRHRGIEFVARAELLGARPKAHQMTIHGGTALDPAVRDALHDVGVWPTGQPSDADRPLLFLALGGSDLVHEIFNKTWANHDFFLPQAADLTDWSMRCIPLRLVAHWLEEWVSKFEPLLALLKATPIDVGGIIPPPPPHRTSEKFVQMLIERGVDPFVAPPLVCVKLHWLVLRKLAAVAAKRQVRFIDTRPIAADGFYLKPEYELDGTHVTRGCAQKILPLLCETFADRTTQAI